MLNLVPKLVARRHQRWARQLLVWLYSADIPAGVKIGQNFSLIHYGFGTVIHPWTEIGDNVRIWHGVTIGRADAHLEPSLMEKILIEDNVAIMTGAVVLGGPGVTRLAEGTLVAANAVLLNSTQPYEIWGGVPARKIGDRRDPPDRQKIFPS